MSRLYKLFNIDKNRSCRENFLDLIKRQNPRFELGVNDFFVSNIQDYSGGYEYLNSSDIAVYGNYNTSVTISGNDRSGHLGNVVFCYSRVSVTSSYFSRDKYSVGYNNLAHYSEFPDLDTLFDSNFNTPLYPNFQRPVYQDNNPNRPNQITQTNFDISSLIAERLGVPRDSFYIYESRVNEELDAKFVTLCLEPRPDFDLNSSYSTNTGISWNLLFTGSFEYDIRVD